ncbi:serine protease [Pseudonocardia sp. GCM10023141]|uniref:serine protease n=1 Tax=Pseudonocardia sp. GCM10023141 TaxID=3252653 RepID=UPI0036245A48
MSVRRRWASAAVGAAGVIALGALTAPAATAATALPSARAVPAATTASGWAPAASAAIHPGVVTETAGGGSCTANFVFTSGDRTFIGQAGHCGGTGAETETNGCTSASVPLGTAVTIKGSDGRARKGTLVYSSWLTMQQLRETDPDTCAFNDFGLVEIDRADVADVNPSLPFFGGPQGIDTDGMQPGETVFSYGNSPLRAGISTLGPKVGISAGDIGHGHGHVVYTLTPGIPGDSGSAYLDGSGDAVGLLSTLNLAPLPVSNGVADLAKALVYANANGGLGDIELALGTEPFTATPVGVPLIALATPAGPPLPPVS